MTRRKAPDNNGFNLAFLDVMACGLGAVILIFMLVDFKDIMVDTSEERKRLEQELAAAESEQSQLARLLDEINDLLAMAASTEEANQSQNQQVIAQQNQLRQAIANEQATIADLEQQKAALLEKINESANIVKAGTGEQNYIVGLPVEGRNIGLLIDKSASMMAVELVDIFLAMALPEAEKANQAKWQRTKNITKWLLSRLPQSSSATAVAFSEDAVVLGQQKVIPATSNALLNTVLEDLAATVPDGGTNLKKGLDTLMQANPNIDSIYLVTDGLPTMGLRLTSRNCLSLTTRKTITAECRAEMGQATFKKFLTKHRDVEINIILLPIEGDPFASSVFWEASLATGGTLLSPAQEWN